MNNYLIAGLVLTMAGVLLGIYDKMKKRDEEAKEEDFEQWLNELDRRVDGAEQWKQQEPLINSDGLVYKREVGTDAFGQPNCLTGRDVINEEHEITIKRRALDKLHHQGMLSQPKPVVYIICEMRVR